MQWSAGGHMMAHPGYSGMMHPRIRGPMYNPSRPMDPRQMEMERLHQHRMQMMHGGPPRPGMHPMHRPMYPEVCHLRLISS